MNILIFILLSLLVSLFYIKYLYWKNRYASEYFHDAQAREICVKLEKLIGYTFLN